MTAVAPDNMQEFRSGWNVVDQLSTLPKLLKDSTRGRRRTDAGRGFEGRQDEPDQRGDEEDGHQSQHPVGGDSGHCLSRRSDLESGVADECR